MNSIQAPPEKKQLPANDSLLISDIAVESANPSMTAFIFEKSGLEPGTWITPEELNNGIDKLFGTLLFDRIDYSFVALDEGYQLVLRIKEKAHSSLNVALHYDNFYGPGLILNYTLLNSLKEGSRAGLTVDISDSPQMRGYYDLHLGKQRNFITSLLANAERGERPIFSNNVDIGNYLFTYLNGGLAFRRMMGTNQQVGIEFYYRYSSLKLSKNIKEVMPDLDLLKNFIFRGPELKFRYELNTYNSNLYPTRGIMLDLEYRQAFQTKFISKYDLPDSLNFLDDRTIETMDPYWHLTGTIEGFLPLGKKVSLNGELAGGLSDDNKPFPDNYFIGGYRYNLRRNQVPFVGLRINELLHGNYLKGKLACQFEPMPNLFISALANLIIVSDEIEPFLEDLLSLEEQTRYVGLDAGFTYKTPIGPFSVYLGSRTDVWNPVWYTNIGFTF